MSVISFNKDNLKGMVFGFISNFVASSALIAYFTGKGPVDGLQEVLTYKHLICGILVLGAIPNLCIFLYYIQRGFNNKAKGVLMFTILISIFNLILKFR